MGRRLPPCLLLLLRRRQLQRITHLLSRSEGRNDPDLRGNYRSGFSLPLLVLFQANYFRAIYGAHPKWQPLGRNLIFLLFSLSPSSPHSPFRDAKRACPRFLLSHFTSLFLRNRGIFRAKGHKRRNISKGQNFAFP